MASTIDVVVVVVVVVVIVPLWMLLLLLTCDGWYEASSEIIFNRYLSSTIKLDETIDNVSTNSLLLML